MFGLEGKKILVTGASSGIGKATAIACSEAGASVYLTARNMERLEQTLAEMKEGNHVIVKADMTSLEDIQNLVGEVDALDGVALVAGFVAIGNLRDADIELFTFREIFGGGTGSQDD